MEEDGTELNFSLANTAGQEKGSSYKKNKNIHECSDKFPRTIF